MNPNASDVSSATPQGRHPAPTRPTGGVRALMLALLVVTAVACLLASALHFGLSISVGSLRLAEPPIFAAAIVEGVIGIALSVATGASLVRAAWAREAALAAYTLGVLGFVVGITIVLRNPGLQTPFNVAVHAGVFPLLVTGLVLTLTPAGRRALTPARETGD